FPVLEIASAHLWGIETETRTAGRRRDRLPITASLLLELLTALIISLILARPNFAGLNQVAHLVVVLDNSASMTAKPPNAPTLRDQALQELQTRVERMGRQTVLTLIKTGTRPVALNGTPVTWAKAQELLSGWQPHMSRHEFQPAWDIASQLAAQSGELLFLTNRMPATSTVIPKLMEVVAVGRPLENVALTTAHWGFRPETQQAHITLRAQNLGNRPARCALVGRSGQSVVLHQELNLEVGENRPLDFEVADGLAQVTLQLDSEADALAIDNRATLIEPRRRWVRYRLNLPTDDGAHAHVLRVLQGIAGLQTSSTTEADLIIDQASMRPVSRRGLWWFGIGPLSRSQQARSNARDVLGPFLIEKRAPLLEGVVLGGIIWAGVQDWHADALPLVSSGTFPLLAQLRSTQTTAFVLNGDLDRSNLSESPDWPILLSNLVELCRADQPGLQRWNYRLNEEFRFRVPPTDSDADPAAGLTLKIPSRKKKPLSPDRNGWVEIRNLDQTGLYSVERGDQTWDRFSVNFESLSQSNLQKLSAGNLPATLRPKSSFAIDDPYTWLTFVGILLGLACLVTNWQHLRRVA
ncbi:MAG: hypothetical protein ABGZ17_11235, partial [Planctomycetaceae bacterium]